MNSLSFQREWRRAPAKGAAELPASLRRCGLLYFTHKKPRMEPRFLVVLAAPEGGDKHNLSLGAPGIKNLGSFIMRYTVTRMLQTTRRVGTYALFADIQVDFVGYTIPNLGYLISRRHLSLNDFVLAPSGISISRVSVISNPFGIR